MDIWLLVAIIAVAGSGLYVAVTFNKRTEQHTAPLIGTAVKDISKEVGEARQNLIRQLNAITDQLQQENRLRNQDNRSIQERLDFVNTRITGIAADLDEIKYHGAQTSTWQDQFSTNIHQQLDHRLGQLGESLGQLSAQVVGIENRINRQKTQTSAHINRIEGSLQDIVTRQSKTHDELVSITQVLDQQREITIHSEEYDRWAAEQMLGTVRQIEAALRSQRVIESYLRVRLDYEVARTGRGHKYRVVTASLRLSEPGADLLWPLLMSFAQTVMLKTVLLDSPRPAGSRSYLLWQSSGGLQLEELLHAKLTACTDEPASSDPASLEGLRSLALGLHGAGPGTIQLGPMIINRTPGALLGCVTSAADAPRNSDVGTLPSLDPDACEAALRELAPGLVTDLTSWADGFL